MPVDADFLFRDAVASFLEYAADTTTLSDLTRRGTMALLGARDINHRLKKLNDELGRGWSEAQQDRLSSAESLAAMAEQEWQRDFPLLHNHALMGLWGALEAMVDDVATYWLVMRPASLQSPAFPKLPVDAANFLSLDAVGQMRLIVDELKRKSAGARQVGLAPFEELLSRVGLGGAVDTDVKSVLRIAKALRNVIAHRGGKVDARLMEVCPELGLSTDERVKITPGQLSSITDAMCYYADSLEIRRRQELGLVPHDQGSLASHISTERLLAEFRPTKSAETSGSA